MLDEARTKVKDNQKFIGKVIPQLLEKIIIASLMKIRNAWSLVAPHNGIHIYGDLED